MEYYPVTFEKKKENENLVSQGNGTAEICFDLRKACDSSVPWETPKDKIENCKRMRELAAV